MKPRWKKIKDFERSALCEIIDNGTTWEILKILNGYIVNRFSKDLNISWGIIGRKNNKIEAIYGLGIISADKSLVFQCDILKKTMKEAKEFTDEDRLAFNEN